MKEFFGDNWQQILSENGFNNFDSLWELDTEWFEPPNHRRGGWSGVAKIKLTLPDGGEVGAFLKRQENHVTKTVFHPIQGVCTFQREFKNILSFINKDLPTVEPIYFSARKQAGNMQAILMTRELEGYQSLAALQFRRGGEISVAEDERIAILQALAALMRKMHDYHLQHNCLYPKHVFVKNHGGAWDVKLLDLEKMKWQLFKHKMRLRDIGTLFRQGAFFERELSDQILFLQTYMREQELSATSTSILSALKESFLVKRRFAKVKACE